VADLAVLRDQPELFGEVASTSTAWRVVDSISEEQTAGLQRRLLITRSMMHDPQLLVLDEPTTGLDPQARIVVWRRIAELRRWPQPHEQNAGTGPLLQPADQAETSWILRMAERGRGIDISSKVCSVVREVV
jgi:ABC-type antimicrobial peptide transport system ATPase subunit